MGATGAGFMAARVWTRCVPRCRVWVGDARASGLVVKAWWGGGRDRGVAGRWAVRGVGGAGGGPGALSAGSPAPGALGSQVPGVHEYARAAGGGAAVAEQEEDAVDHVLCLCRDRRGTGGISAVCPGRPGRALRSPKPR